MERALLIPVKELSNAKHRLAPFLSPDERREMAWLMLRGVMQAAAELPQALRKVVVTSYAPAKELAATATWRKDSTILEWLEAL